MTFGANPLEEPPRGKLDLARVALHAEKEAARRRAAWEGHPVVRRKTRRRRGDDSAVPLATAICELFADVISDVPVRDAFTVVADWDNLAGPLARYILPISFEPETGTLSVRAVSPAWAANLRLLAPKVITRLNEQLGSNQIRQLRIYAPAQTPGARIPVKRPGASTAPELRDALHRQRQNTRREPEDLFQAGQEAQARASRSQTAQQKAAIVRLRAQTKARQLTISAGGPAASTAAGQPGQQHSEGEGGNAGGET